jgi:ABC-type proline/glycine betaine transport system permease subunit
MTDHFMGLPLLPLDMWIQTSVDWFVGNFRPFFQAVRIPIATALKSLLNFLLFFPPWAWIFLIGLVGYVRAGLGVGLFAAASLLLIGLMGLWSEAMTTISIILTTLCFALVVGIPVGILASRSEPVWSFLRPLLDVMQTTPSFVYLVPVVMLFGIGTVSGVIATIIFSLPPLIRLTNLGLRQVDVETVEAARSFGTTEWQMLRNITLPLALPSIMAGINQTLLLAMVMSSIAAMIGAEGLGLVVLRGIGRLDIGLAATGGLSLVFMAITIDRIAQSFSDKDRPPVGALASGTWARWREAFIPKLRARNT